ncbi:MULTISPECIES: hypothetical protein [Bacillus]|uniref:Uncharacterized protein n=1 Tax=Bacillus glycinifermentans TaxID=1664069 RepID=A0AAJ3Z1C1_9BACI|nr:MULTISPECIES: hypothetical protein [Bacillus]KKB74961.1 hypothetical protein TH62_03930 [Bacillus sp. TH008]MDU0071097.1 hypothetical protein [Bacillus sp. IG6]MED8018965.1 hypothetical protein [Bacillus glycinifermentans]QAT65660.1 hypothetical protein EQZ20_12630 [Bacillus glycinifermentans]
MNNPVKEIVSCYQCCNSSASETEKRKAKHQNTALAVDQSAKLNCGVGEAYQLIVPVGSRLDSDLLIPRRHCKRQIKKAVLLNKPFIALCA